MGDEIQQTSFHKKDFRRFEKKLTEETELLEEWLEKSRFADDPLTGGLELEVFLVDERLRPLPENEEFLKRLNNPLVVPELARFNFELNTHPRRLTGSFLSDKERALEDLLKRCRETARDLGADILVTGILPTLRDEHLSLANMSGWQRYRALNEQVLRLRRGRPVRLNISGRESLRVTHTDVMLEAAATSLQIHTQVPARSARAYYNCAQALSGPLVAIAANSPFLFGKDLWAESRVPLFEQAVAVHTTDESPRNRVYFGSGYARESLLECFHENRRDFAVLLPINLGGDTDQLSHLRLHNGTIWRWNRPIIGFGSGPQDTTRRPHLRIEHRVIPAGPGLIDSVANMAFYLGLLEEYHGHFYRDHPLDFERARDNFYRAAREGLECELTWLNGERQPAAVLIRDTLLPVARRGLEKLRLDEADINRFLGVIEERAATGRTGSRWQRNFVARQGRDTTELTRIYKENSESGDPVARWQ